jgi:hypothetical protein
MVVHISGGSLGPTEHRLPFRGVLHWAERVRPLNYWVAQLLTSSISVREESWLNSQGFLEGDNSWRLSDNYTSVAFYKGDLNGTCLPGFTICFWSLLHDGADM